MSTAPFVADADLRLDALPTLSRPRDRMVVAVLAALLLEAGVGGLIWFERNVAPPPDIAEIPIEVVVEPPPAPAETPAPDLAQQQEIEKPATDAPREGKSDHDDEHVAEKEKPAAAPPPPPAPTPPPEATQPAAETPAPELPKTEEAEAPPPVKAETPPAPAPSPKPTQFAALPKTFESVPDVDFGGAAIKSPVTGGNARSTYLTMLYGLIVPRLHVPSVAHAYGRRLTGAIGFQVDGRGRITMRFIAEPSGSMELDEAAMQAVAAASRSFPPPPKGAPIGMKFTYTVQ